MRILLTGATGQIGNLLKPALEARGWEVIAPSRGTLDLVDPDSIIRGMQEVKPQLVINTAAYTDVDMAEGDKSVAMAINGIAPGILAEQAKKSGISLIHYSTDYVFDGTKRGPDGELAPYTEKDTPNPINVYGKTKLEGEKAIQASGCHHLILRTSWVFSMHGSNFLLSMLRLASKYNTLTVVNDQWGGPTWAGWIAQASADLIDQKNSSKLLAEGILHLVNGGRATWYDFAKEIFNQAKKNGLVDKIPALVGVSTQEYPLPASRPINSLLAATKFFQICNKFPPEWQESFALCMYLNNIRPYSKSERLTIQPKHTSAAKFVLHIT